MSDSLPYIATVSVSFGISQSTSRYYWSSVVSEKAEENRRVNGTIRVSPTVRLHDQTY